MVSDLEHVDLEGLRGWIGRRETVSDIVTARLDASLRAVLDHPDDAATGGPALPTVHWCLAPVIAPMSALGADGHPARGGFMPPVPLPRRMWAGGELTFHAPLHVGDIVTRDSTIEAVTVKTGRSGPLCFVTVRHRLGTSRGPALDERQDIVFRAATTAGSAPHMVAAPGKPRWQRTRPCDPVLLFRYSALTFNGHRIHYDRSYAMEEEGYPDLVVHGPLQATALVDFAVELRGSVPRVFAFRSVSPLFANAPFSVNAVEEADGLRLWTADADGRLAMEASATWS